MTERVLGSIIMGGIALVGVVWALIDGIPPLVNAQKNESALEDKILEIVKKDYDSTVNELDIRRVTYITKDIEEEYRGSTRIVKKPVISLEGYNDKDELFLVKIVGTDDYILDLKNKIGSSEAAAYISLEYDVYQNYSMTLSELLNEIMKDRDTEFESYAVGSDLYTRVQSDAGATIFEIGDIKGDYDDIKIYSTSEAVEETKEFKYGEKSEEEVYLQGTIVSVESTYDESTKITSYNIRLVTEGVDELHLVEVYSAKLFGSLNGADLVPGAKVLVKGYLSTNMSYTTK